MTVKEILKELKCIIKRIDSGLYPINIISEEVRNLKDNIENDL